VLFRSEHMYFDSLVILSRLPDVVLQLSGAGAAPHLVMSPLSLDFGDVHVDSIATRTFTVSDTGYWDLQISGLQFTHGQAFHLTPVPQLPDTVPARGTLSYTVQFHPTVAGQFADTLTIMHDAGNQIRVELMGRSVREGIRLTPSTLNFGNVIVDSMVVDSFQILNTGSASLRIDSISSNISAFIVVNQTFAVDSGQSHSVRVSYHPLDTLHYEGIITVFSSAGDSLLHCEGHGLPLGVDGRRDGNLPSEFYLVQNYPNPFNPTTSFGFGVPKSSRVVIRVYDILGRELAVIADANYSAGRYTVIWDCRNCASGIYLVVMQGTGFNIVRKATLLR
jgi:hypothetical protein